MSITLVALEKSTGRLVSASVRSKRQQAFVKTSGVGALVLQGDICASYIFAGAGALNSGDYSGLHQLMGNDSSIDTRQLALIDSRGSISVFTGKNCVGAAQHAVNDADWCVAALCMHHQDQAIPEVMATKFMSAQGTLEEKLLEALGAVSCTFNPNSEAVFTSVSEHDVLSEITAEGDGREIVELLAGSLFQTSTESKKVLLSMSS